MRIGIISINAHTKVLNCASPLHSYVFQQFLLENGIESEIINYKPVYYGKYDPKYPLFYYIDHPKNNEKEQKKLLKKWKNLFWDRAERFDKFQKFIDTYYITTKKCYTAEILDKEDPGYDCYICATDVIWKYNPNNGFDKGFLLACNAMKGKGKIAYAASRGATNYTIEQEKEFLSYISDIDYISAREKSLQNYVSSLLPETNIAHVLDPVFLEPKNFYENLAIEPKEQGYVLIYIVMEKTKSLVKTAVNFAKEHNLKVIELSENLEDKTIPQGTQHDVIYNTGIEEWLGYMKNADYIFTNSFHACCFSMIFEKEFWAGQRSGDKINSVLELFQLENRRIDDRYENGGISLACIDYDKVNEIKDKYYVESKDFILEAIHDIEQRVEKGKFPRERLVRQTRTIAIESESSNEETKTDQKVVEVEKDKREESFWNKLKRKFLN